MELVTPTSAKPQAFRSQRAALDAIFQPRTIAVIGASERECSVGHAVIRNLTSGDFTGEVIPVNAKHGSILGVRAYRSVLEIEQAIDLAVIATPARSVPQVVRECVDAGVRGAVIISAGFKEAGPAGAALEAQIREAACGSGMRIIGPNCLGLMNPVAGLNATFASRMALGGSVGFISQSGALCTAVLDWSLRQRIGFSAFVSVGSMLDVGWGDLISYLGDDPRTKSIVLYMESVGDARSFLSAARAVAMNKPIIAIKVGRTEAASRAAASHTGAMTGSDDVLDAAFKRAGILRVETIAELFDMVDVLALQPRPVGPRLTIVTNAGGPGVLATDMLIENGGELATLTPAAIGKLNAMLPPHWSHNNPIDVLGDASPATFLNAAKIAAENPESDGTLAILAPQAMTDPTETARQLAGMARSTGKPLLASWMGGETVAEAREILQEAGVPCFEFPDAAARAFCHTWSYKRNLDALYETPLALDAVSAHSDARASVTRIVSAAREAGTTILDEHVSKQILNAYGLTTSTTIAANSADEAVRAAQRMGFPVVLKLLSTTIVHKSDVGGVRLNLSDSDSVREAFDSIRRAIPANDFRGISVQRMFDRERGFELILGSSLDAQFGPIVLFGAGGLLVEVLHDRALGLPPLTATLARRIVEQTKISKAFCGARGRTPVDLAALDEYLVRFSQLVIDQPLIKEIDINPLLVCGDQIIALDARIILHPANVDARALPRAAIRPYPQRYVQPWTTKRDDCVMMRPIRPEDEAAMVSFHKSLSDQTVQQRYFGSIKLDERIAHDRLRRISFNDYDREIVLVVDRTSDDGQHEIVGVGRLSRVIDRNAAEFALVLANAWQGLGVGLELLRRLVNIARDEQIATLTGEILPDNQAMIAVARRVGFEINLVENIYRAKLNLAAAGAGHESEYGTI